MTLGKRKGSSFEREYAKKISLWLSNNKNADSVWRSSGSGSKATITNSKIQCGDLISVSEESKEFFDKFSVELKNYKAFDLFSIINKNFLLIDWWNQCVNDAKRANKIPLLIFRINRKGDWVVLEKHNLAVDYSKSIEVTHSGNRVIIIPADSFFGLKFEDIFLLKDENGN